MRARLTKADKGGLILCLGMFLASLGWGLNAGPGILQASDSAAGQGQAAQSEAPQEKQVANAKPVDQSLPSAEAARQRQLIEDTDRLYVLATELKSEVDKSNKNTLSIQVIKKADEIEKLARSIRDLTKQN
jgi:hypothetical protein